MSCSIKYTHAKDDIFKPANIDIVFLRKISKLLIYNMFFLTWYQFGPDPIDYTVKLRTSLISNDNESWFFLQFRV